MAQVARRDLERATPCVDFTARALMGHLIGTAERGLATAESRPTGQIPHVITDVPDDQLASRYGALRRHVRTAWLQLDPGLAVQAPWGTTTVGGAAWGFATETLVHGQGLAIATGQPSEAHPGLVQPVLDQASTTLPALGRKPSYGNVVTSGRGVGATKRLANWLGHQR